jgi:nuclear transport factor 2 (NTF2) superfamily protein
MRRNQLPIQRTTSASLKSDPWPVASDELRQFAARYADAWSTRDPNKVVAFYAKNASININNGPKTTIAEVASGFMRDFPDMIVSFDKLESRGDKAVFHWTLVGTHAGSGNQLRISGYELWKIDPNGLIAESTGHFDAADYERQLQGRDR